jgi:magnesium-transporting ATPase (P-type)
MSEFYHQDIQAALDALNVEAEQGLSDAEVQARRQQYGPQRTA